LLTSRLLGFFNLLYLTRKLEKVIEGSLPMTDQNTSGPIKALSFQAVSENKKADPAENKACLFQVK